MKWPYELGTSLPTLQRDFELVVATFERPLVQFLFRFVFDHGTALDLAQETFVKAFQNLSRYDNTRAFSTWLFAIASNLAKDHVRKTTRRTALFAGAAADSADEVCFNQPDRNLDTRELGDAIEAAIASLPLIYREPLLFRHAAGLSIDETAEALGTSTAVVKTRLFRARQLLQETLGKEWLAR
jgi:RNA polymerase sigma-70 factor (ECF subfamily)